MSRPAPQGGRPGCSPVTLALVRLTRLALAPGLVAALVTGPAHAAPVGDAARCGADLPAAGRQVLVADATRLVFAPHEPIRVGRHFGLDVQLCGAPGLAAPPLLQVDADMPAHRHGMNYRASVTPGSAPGRYVIEGLMLHMPGRWRFSFDLGGATPQRLTHEVDVP